MDLNKIIREELKKTLNEKTPNRKTSNRRKLNEAVLDERDVKDIMFDYLNEYFAGGATPQTAKQIGKLFAQGMVDSIEETALEHDWEDNDEVPDYDGCVDTFLDGFSEGFYSVKDISRFR